MQFLRSEDGQYLQDTNYGTISYDIYHCEDLLIIYSTSYKRIPAICRNLCAERNKSENPIVDACDFQAPGH